MYLYGLSFTVVADHQSMVSLYNNPKLARPAGVEHHCLKLHGYCFKVVYQRGSKNPVDYNSLHPLEARLENQDDDVLYVNAVIDHNLPDVITLNILQTATNKGDTSENLKYCVLTKKILPKNVPELQPCKRVFHELWVGKKLVLPWNCIVIPESLQADIIMLANEGHQEISKIKSYLR